MTEVVLSWGALFVLLVVAFRLLSRYQQRRPPIRAVTVLLHALSVGISLAANVVCTVLLYEPVISMLAVNTDGFMNMNGIFTLAVIWLAVCVLALVIIVRAQLLWGAYFRTLRTTQIVFLLLPLLFVVVSMFLVALKS